MKNFKEYRFAVIRGKTSFYVRSIGHFRQTPESPEGIKIADFGEIFWCIGGKALFHLNGSIHTLNPGFVWYYPPGSRHEYYPGKPFFHYRWLTLEGPGVSGLFDGLRIQPGLNEAGECPQELFSRIELEIESVRNEKRMAVLAAAFEILTRAAVPPAAKSGETTAEKAKRIIDKNFTNKELNVDRIAELLGVHRVSLSRAFSVFYGHSASEYLTSCRIRKALSLLKESTRSAEEISEECGFSNPGYFSKVIAKTTGFPPRKLRG